MTRGGPLAAFWLVMSGMLAFAPPPVAAAPAQFDIPAGPASQTLRRFAEQSGLPIAVPLSLTAGKRTRAVRGALEPDVALRRLLQGSGLAATRNAQGQIVIANARQPVASAPAPGAALPAGGSSAAERELAEVKVSGSRISLPGMSTPTPVTVVSREELSALSTGTLAEALVELPQFLNNDTPQSQSFGTSAAAGASYLNLRGIGSIRTLTLLDGRRIVPATRFGTVDYALLPRALLDSVEVVTGGASAAYGSDAVSGVVNLSLDSHFEGLQATVQGGLSQRHDNPNGEVTLTWGTRIGPASHLVFSGELYRADGIRGYRNRGWFDSWASISNTDPAAGPALVTVNDVRSTAYTYGGLITSGPLAGTQFLPGGEVAPFARGSFYSGSTQSGGDGVDPAADLVWLMPDQRRANGLLKFTTEVTPQSEVFLQVLAAHSDNRFNKDPPALWGIYEPTIYADNAFLPSGLRQQMATQGINSFRLGKVAPDDELGSGLVHNEGHLLSATVGASHAIGAWRIDGYYQYGHNRNLLRYLDTMRIDRVYRGIDSVRHPVTGEIVCRSTLTFPDDGCVPVNIFGEGMVSEQARAWLTEGRYTQAQRVEQQVAELSVQGTLFDLPSGAVHLAAGASWRRDSVTNTPRRYPASLEDVRMVPAAQAGYRGLPAAYVGVEYIFERVVVNRVAGGYGVWEAFGEMAVPLATDLPLLQNLTLHGAVRVARYSGSGTEPAWKAGLEWRPIAPLRLRVTRSRDIRAGSLSERFDTSNSGVTIFDSAAPTPGFYTVGSVRTGNPEVDPELADTWTGGLVFTPSGGSGFSMSADYYDIRIQDAIGLLGAQSIVSRCNNGETSYCDLVQRDDSNGRVIRVRNLILNLTEARTRGIDLELGWRHPVVVFGGEESAALRVFLNRMLESSVTGISGIKLDRTDQTGLTGGAPLWQANMSLAYWRGPLHLTLQQRLISAGRYNAALLPTSTSNGNRIPAQTYTNLRASWHSRAIPGLTTFAQVSNMFDRDPPRASSWGFAGSLPTNESLFDVVGRRFVVGATWQR